MAIDLDDLVTRCADPRSREYIREAVQCYRAGAYRSSIVACWIAVAFDLVDKIREIAAGGDSAAKNEIERFDRIRQADDLPGALAFEKDLPKMALEKFEFISPIEHVDIARLVQDRNRCAHPSRVSETEVFQPSEELALVHIVNAARSVLWQPATQGKAALNRLIGELQSRIFPLRSDDVRSFLEDGPMARPREALLRNYIAVLLKASTEEGVATGIRPRALTAIWVLRDMHGERADRAISDCLHSLVSHRSSDAELAALVRLVNLRRGTRLWELLENADRVKLRTFVADTPTTHFDVLEVVSDEGSPMLSECASRISRASAQELASAHWLSVPQAAIARMIALCRFAEGPAEADERCACVGRMAYASKRPKDDAETFVQAGASNGNIRVSPEFAAALRAFARLDEVGREGIRLALDRAGLSVPF
jgi:hypothetical protein